TFTFSGLTADPKGVAFAVTNTGSRPGAAIAQVYVGPAHSSVPRPAKELKGFARISLQPGETKAVRVPLNTPAFAYYYIKTRKWHAEKGVYDVLVGSSSDRVELSGKVTLAADTFEP